MGIATLFTQIKAAYTADSPLSSALNALQFGEVVGSPSFPYGTYHYISATGEHTAGDALLAERLIQFNIFDKNTDWADLMDCYDKLTAVYDEANIISGGRAYKFTWEGDWPLTEDGINQISVRYRIMDHPG